MIAFPIFEQLSIDNYGLFPGKNQPPSGIDIHFLPGLTFILGANGLGKTTLIKIIYRLLTGPSDIPGLTDGDLGTARLEAKNLPDYKRRIFGQRVADAAIQATARISLKLGTHTVIIERNLKDLSLINFFVDDKEFGADESGFQSEIIDLVGVWSFGDWILILRYLIFYLEDRRDLVWDNSAQRQLLRALFLPANQAQNWTLQERAILALDSEYRNLRAVVYREEKKLAKSEATTQRAGGLNSEWESLTSLQETDQSRNAELLREFYEVDKIRQEARRSMMIAEEEYEVTLRNYERAKLIVLQTRFPDQTETARYILGYLITTGECLVCGNNVPDVADMLNNRITSKQCVVCSSDLTMGSYPIDTSLVYHRAEKAERELQEISDFLMLKKHEFNDAEANYKQVAEKLSELNRNMEQRRDRIEIIFNLLPKKEIDLQRQHDEFTLLRGRLEQLKHDLDGQIKTFESSLASWKRQIVANATEIQHICNEYAQQFLTETCSLSWVPYLSMLGQTGARIEFPAFAIEMTGTDFPSAVRRDGPDKVSESQREFIDLSFRMALMQVAGTGATSLVIDAPESSLDAVFVRKAAEVLNDFSKPDRDNRLLITSNLVDGSLIPSLLKQFSSEELADRIINLFELATPTAAVTKYAEEYKEHYNKIIGSTTSNEPSL